MWKRWLNVLICFWLVNSITYYHASNPFDHSQDVNEATVPCLNINTWVDALTQAIVHQDKSSSKSQHKIKSPRRFVHTRVNTGGLFLAVVCLLLLYACLRKVKSTAGSQYSIGFAWLPAYYNFLFRLSPF